MSTVGVFVLDTKRKPLAPCHPAIARKLLKQGKAAIFRRYPFTIILKQEIKNPFSPPQRLKLDPGSKVTGLAILNDKTGNVVFGAELQHRGEQIKAALFSRRAIRRSRRGRKTRYRQPRFSNRRHSRSSRSRGSWLPPSLESRVRNVETWVRRLRKLCPLQAISLELVRFDTQKLQNPEILSVEYQQGELFGYDVREYLLLKWERKCAYCGAGAKDIPLEIEHIVPKSRGGSDRVSNLTLSCQPCNQKKGNQTAEEFGYPEVQARAKRPLKDVAAVNATRWEIYHQLLKTELSIEVGSGRRTKFNRIQRGLPKSHWIDAVCVGESTPETLEISRIRPLYIVACGRGNRQMCRVDRFGFPRTRAKRKKRVHGFQTGDLVQATIPSGKKAGTYIGRVAVRSSGNFNLKTQFGLVQGISYRYCYLLQGIDGYYYEYGIRKGKGGFRPN